MDYIMIAANIAQVIIALFVVAAFGVAVYQLRINMRVTKARIVTDFLNIYYADKDMQEIVRVIESGTYEHQMTTEQSQQLNKLLWHFNGLAYLWQNGSLKLDDLLPAGYLLGYVMNSGALEEHFLRSKFPPGEDEELNLFFLPLEGLCHAYKNRGPLSSATDKGK